MPNAPNLANFYTESLKLRIASLELAMSLVNAWFGRWDWGGELYVRLSIKLWNTQKELDNFDEFNK